MGNDDLIGNKHATNVHPSGEHHHGVHHCEECGNGRHDDGVGLSGGPQHYERFRDALRAYGLGQFFRHLESDGPHCGSQDCGVRGYDGQHHELDVRVYLSG